MFNNVLQLVSTNTLFYLTGLVEEGYHSTNPYHNSIHATDVTQAMHCFLQEEKVCIQFNYYSFNFLNNNIISIKFITFVCFFHYNSLQDLY